MTLFTSTEYQVNVYHSLINQEIDRCESQKDKRALANVCFSSLVTNDGQHDEQHSIKYIFQWNGIESKLQIVLIVIDHYRQSGQKSIDD